ncbi:MAG: 6-phosphofructokinase [Acidobacteria bacterium]|nr:MAG: 6-phosphofructokinase [Acidobacteriota bacterium]
MRLGVLTGGGDCPGLNAAIRAIVRRALHEPDTKVLGFKYGWAGLISGETVDLDLAATKGIVHRGGTILGTSRTNPYKDPSDERPVGAILATLESLGIDALVPIGGEDTLGVAMRLHEDEGVPIVGVPKTIDNDLSETDFTFGFQTAVQIATDAIDRLHTTAESHNRVMVVEVMGRHAGWIATYSGIAGGADVILIPEKPFDIAEVAARIQHRHDQGRLFSIVVAAEGAMPVGGEAVLSAGETDAFGHTRLGGIGNWIQEQLEKMTGFETRTTILGHVQRGGTPVAFDRVLATRFGVAAAEAALTGQFGTMVAINGTSITLVSLASAVGKLKTIDPELVAVSEVFFG